MWSPRSWAWSCRRWVEPPLLGMELLPPLPGMELLPVGPPPPGVTLGPPPLPGVAPPLLGVGPATVRAAVVGCGAAAA